jgi:hypothetical protein
MLQYLIVGKHLLTTFILIPKSLKGTINNLRQLLLWNCTLISNPIYFKNRRCFHDFNDTKFFLNGCFQFHNLESAARTRLHPYHLQRVQDLKPKDPPRRIAFCQCLLQKIDEEPNFLSSVLTTDEVGFTRDGVFNSHNTHIWSEENPHQIRERGFQQRFSINVWAGIIGNRLIGPNVLPPHLNGEGYLIFLQNELSDLLDDVPLQVRRDMWYLHDGAPAHSARGVKNWLDANLENRWIGRNGPVLWPARAPELNPCDFFLWGHLKQIVYETPVNTVEELTVRVNNAT